MAVTLGVYFYPVCILAFRLHGGHISARNNVESFSNGLVQSLAE